MKKSEAATLIIVTLFLTLNIYLNTKQLEEYQEEILRLNSKVTELEEKIETFLDKWNVGVFELTAYAPLDPRAVKGMCYSGDPRVTASGVKTKPGVTIAAGPSMPFGTKVYIQGHGWREVQDRGGRIGNNNIDIAVDTLEEAYRVGRQKAVVVWES